LRASCAALTLSTGAAAAPTTSGGEDGDEEGADGGGGGSGMTTPKKPSNAEILRGSGGSRAADAAQVANMFRTGDRSERRTRTLFGNTADGLPPGGGHGPGGDARVEAEIGAEALMVRCAAVVAILYQVKTVGLAMVSDQDGANALANAKQRLEHIASILLSKLGAQVYYGVGLDAHMRRGFDTTLRMATELTFRRTVERLVLTSGENEWGVSGPSPRRRCGALPSGRCRPGESSPSPLARAHRSFPTDQVSAGI